MTTFGYCECGCGERTPIAQRTDSAKGWIAGQPLRFVRGHNSRLNAVEYTVDPVTSCWIWRRAIRGGDGYGQAYDEENRPQLAHRLVYERNRGPIPAGLTLDHLCRNRACVNPDHLEPVPIAENCRRGAKAKLTPVLVRQIRSSNLSNGRLAEQLGVGKETVRAARIGISWGAV